MKGYDVLISHSSADKAWTRRFAESLKHRGLRVLWLDEQHLAPEKQWQSQHQKALQASDLFLTVVNPKNLTKPDTFFELGAAVGMGKKVALIASEQLQSEENLPVSDKYIVTKSTPAKTAEFIRNSIAELVGNTSEGVVK